MYENYNSKFNLVKRTVYKWWCVVYKPVYKLTHDGYWPQEKDPSNYGVAANNSSPNSATSDFAKQMAMQLANNQQANVDQLIMNSISNTTPSNSNNQIFTNNTLQTANLDSSSKSEETTTHNDIPADVDSDVLDRANEIMARLAREAAQDEEKKQQEIANAKKQADDKQRLESIMKANEVDISAFIEEGRAHQADQES